MHPWRIHINPVECISTKMAVYRKGRLWLAITHIAWIFLYFGDISLASPSGYASLCDSVFCKVLSKSMRSVRDVNSIVEAGNMVPDLGARAESICASATQELESEAPVLDDSRENVEILDRRVEELTDILDSSLQVVFLKQLTLLKESAVMRFRRGAQTEGAEFQSFYEALEYFQTTAAETVHNRNWNFEKERANLKNALNEVIVKSKALTDTKLQHSRSNQVAMQYLQMQQQQLQAMQQQQMQGSNSPWACGFAYRIPDSNININCNYQQGKSNIQVSCVPDESIGLLGANGFVHGVTPGNLGVSISVNL